VQPNGTGYEIRDIILGSDGELGKLLYIPASGCRMPATEETVKERQHFMKMYGQELFKHAVRRMEAASKECLEKAGLTEEQLNWLIPHQANIRIIEAMGKRFNLPWERVYRTIHKYGNTSSSTVPIALAELDSVVMPKAGENILLVAFGGGLTWGATLLTKVTE
jgi:3-oxoacyl-[acyl-carrier-protein] synthase-3